MQIEVPIKIVYQTPDRVPIGDVIDSLVALRHLLEEGCANLGLFSNAIMIEKVQVDLQSVTQESPLRELIFVTLFFTYQDELKVEVPAAIESLTGIHVSPNYDAMITVSALLLVYYGASLAKDLISKVASNTILKTAIDDQIAILSKEIGVPEAEIRKKLLKKYKRKQLKSLAQFALRFFRPSKSQSDAAIDFGTERIEPRLIAEVPQDYQLAEAMKVERARAYIDVPLELHAQDKDKDAAGWAAIPVGIDSKRIRMKLVDGVTPDQLWNRDEVVADVVIKYRRTGDEFEPYEIHLTRLKG